MVPRRRHVRPQAERYLTLVLLIGLLGGVAMGSVAAARRTQSSYATFLASTSPSDLGLSVQSKNLTATPMDREHAGP